MTARRGTIVIIAGLAGLALLTALLLGGAAWFLSSESGLRWAVEEALSRTAGKLKLEGATGSLAGTTRIARLTYTDKDMDFVAENVEFTWSPRALFSRSVVIDSLSASQITLDVKPGDGVNTPPDFTGAAMVDRRAGARPSTAWTWRAAAIAGISRAWLFATQAATSATHWMSSRSTANGET